MNYLRLLFIGLMLIITSPLASANIFPEGSCPSGSIQTWLGSGGDVKFEGDSSQLINNKGIGYWTIIDNHNTSCGSSPCFVNWTKILREQPNVSVPSHAINIEDYVPNIDDYIDKKKIKLDQSDEIHLTSGIYFSELDIELKEGSKLIVSGDVKFYVKKFDTKGRALIQHNNINSDDEFYLIGGHIKLKTDSTTKQYVHIVSYDHVDLENKTQVEGSITSKKSHIKGEAVLHTSLPSDCDNTPSYSSDAKYEFGVKECTSMPCTIEFDPSIDYDFTPLVFVMPTIDENDPDIDAPSSLYIRTVGHGSVVIDQRWSDEAQASSGTEERPITSVSYFIIEPGITEIDGHQVVSGYTSTNQISRHYDPDDDPTVSSTRQLFSEFGLNSFDTDDVAILHQIQSNYNSSKWMTSGRLRQGSNDNNSVALTLELSKSFDENYLYKQEKVAFLATKPSGVLLVNDSQLQFLNNFNTKSIADGESFEDSCNEHWAETDLTSINGIIGNKQQRNGRNGGWLRRCKAEGNKASFIIDEDAPLRGHNAENVGLVAFERVFSFPDVCPYFPNAVQTWEKSNTDSGNGHRPLFVKADSYIDNNKSKYVGFHDASQLDVSNESCLLSDGSKVACEHNKTLMVEKPPFDSNFPNPNMSPPDNNYFTPGSYGIVNLTSSASFEPGIYYFEQITIIGFDIELDFSSQQKTMLNVKSFLVSGTVNINQTGSRIT